MIDDRKQRTTFSKTCTGLCMETSKVILRGLIPVLLADDLYGGCLAHFGPAVQARYRSASRPDRSHDRPYGWAYYVMLRATRDDLRMFHGPGRSVDITCRQAQHLHLLRKCA